MFSHLPVLGQELHTQCVCGDGIPAATFEDKRPTELKNLLRFGQVFIDSHGSAAINEERADDDDNDNDLTFESWMGWFELSIYVVSIYVVTNWITWLQVIVICNMYDN